MFRWRGRLNMKDITERAISGIIAGVIMGGVFIFLDRLLG